jgi:hypothetical protein
MTTKIGEILSNEIFSVDPPFDIAMNSIYMDEEGWRHLLLGHRELRSTPSLLSNTISQATSVHTGGIAGRYYVRSTNVLSRGGKPMGVLIEREGERGRAFSASPADHLPGSVIWESSGSLYTSYDARSDVLYVSKGGAVSAYVKNEEDFDRIWMRVSEADDAPVGVTVFDMKGYWLSRKQELINRVSNFLRLLDTDIRYRIDRILSANA